MSPLPDAALADTVAGLEARARAATNLAELGFSIANDAHVLVPFRQALVFADDGAHGEMFAVSGLARPSEDSPYLVWLRRAWPWLRERIDGRPGWLTLATPGSAIPDDIADGWREWWPDGVFALPLRRRSGEPLACVCLLLESEPPATLAAALTQLAATWSYCWEMLGGRPAAGWRVHLHRLSATQRRLTLIAALLLLLVPVRETALAPAEIIALDALAVASPLDGVVKTIHVRPNQPVRAGERLFSLDDTTLRNRLDVSQKSVAVADAELAAMTQKAFDNPQSKSELSLLGGRARERRAELAAISTQLARIDVVAAQDGIAVFADANDWLGRPVSTGERIMLLANPDRPGIAIHLPVADAIALEVGAPVKLFVTVAPLSPLSAKVIETSYQAVLSPDAVASYRLRAAFAENGGLTRIGLRGTAKLYGEWVALGYYLLRRPLASLREWSGW